MIHTFKLDDLEIQISEQVFGILSKYRQLKKHQPESGGILLAQVSNKTVYILKATVPSKFDKASRTSFERNKDVAQVLVNYEFVNSGNTIIYVGEWHTHPEAVPSPSGTDRKMIQDQFKENKLNEPFVILMIQGTEAIYLGKYDGKNFVSTVIHE